MEIINSDKSARGKRIFEGSGFYIPLITKHTVEIIQNISVMKLESSTFFKNILNR